MKLFCYDLKQLLKLYVGQNNRDIYVRETWVHCEGHNLTNPQLCDVS